MGEKKSRSKKTSLDRFFQFFEKSNTNFMSEIYSIISISQSESEVVISPSTSALSSMLVIHNPSSELWREKGYKK